MAARNTHPEADAAMERYAAGDDSAFGELYDQLAPSLHAYLLRRTRDPQRAEDLMQQTLLQMHRARGRFVAGAAVRPWMYAIAHRLVIDAARRDGRELGFEDGEESEVPCGVAGADEWVDARRLATRLDRQLGRIPEAQRVAYEMVHQEGLSLRQAAEALGTTVTAIKLRTHRAYVALRSALGDHGAGS